MSDDDIRQDLSYLTRQALLACIAATGNAIDLIHGTDVVDTGPCPTALTSADFGITFGECTLMALGSSDDDDDADEDMQCSAKIEALYHLRSPAPSGARHIEFIVRLRPEFANILNREVKEAELYEADLANFGPSSLQLGDIDERDRQLAFDDVQERAFVAKQR